MWSVLSLFCMYCMGCAVVARSVSVLEQRIRDLNGAVASKDTELLAQQNKVAAVTKERDSIKAMLVCGIL
jgi:hypothetical protein